jgi:FtsZ-interacting cell division protein YlmF
MDNEESAMTIEEALSRLAINTGRIADALEAIANSQGIVPEAPGEPEKKEPAKPAAKKTTKKKASKKASKKKTVGKETEKSESKLTIADDVRPVLKRLRDEVNHAAVKSLLKKYGASTIPTLDPKHFENIIADALKELGDAEDDADDIDLDDDGQDDLLDDLDDDDDL